MLVAYQINRGARFRLIAIGTQEDEKINLPYFEFQQEALHRAPKEWPKMVRILDYVIEAGPPKDAEKSKLLREGIFEFRTKGGLRLLWFYDEGRVVICVTVTSNKARRPRGNKSTKQFSGKADISKQSKPES